MTLSTTERAPEVLAFLLRSAVIEPHRLLDHGLVLTPIGRSNAVFLVETGDETGDEARLIVKSVGGATDRQGSGAVERLVYEHVADQPWVATAPIARLVRSSPDFLAIEALGESGTDGPLHDPSATRRLLRSIGASLGRWHTLAASSAGVFAPTGVPWIFDVLTDGVPAVMLQNEGTRALRDEVMTWPSMAGQLRATSARWVAETVVHGDVRFDNVVRGMAGEAVLVDWELAGVGDPAWDVACIAADVIAQGVAAPSAERLRGADAVSCSLSPVAAKLASFGVAYRRGGPVNAESILDRAGGYVGARIVQIAFQQAAWTTDGGGLGAVDVARFGAALLTEPTAASAALLASRWTSETRPP